MIVNTFAVALIDQIRLHTLASGTRHGQLLLQQKHMNCSLHEHSFCFAFALRAWHRKRTIDSIDRIPLRVRRDDAIGISLFHRSMWNRMHFKMTSTRTVSEARWQCYRRNKMLDEVFVRFTCVDYIHCRSCIKTSNCIVKFYSV
jgi:hypothetical protein